MRKFYKTIIVCAGLGVVVAGGVVFFEGAQVENYFESHSQCTFDPFIKEEIKALIRETIVTVANGGAFSLMGKKSHLIAIGDEISAAVTDFAYWAYVFSTPELALDMKKIQGTSVKYTGFVKGTQNKLTREYKENPCFFEQAGGFAEYLHLPKEELVALLKSCLEKSATDKYAFEKYLDYLIAHKSDPLTFYVPRGKRHR